MPKYKRWHADYLLDRHWGLWRLSIWQLQSTYSSSTSSQCTLWWPASQQCLLTMVIIRLWGIGPSHCYIALEMSSNVCYVIALTHWGRDKMAAIFQTTFSNAFSWMSSNVWYIIDLISFWRNFRHWLYRKLACWQLPAQQLAKISSKWRHFNFNELVYSPIGYHWHCIFSSIHFVGNSQKGNVECFTPKKPMSCI